MFLHQIYSLLKQKDVEYKIVPWHKIQALISGLRQHYKTLRRFIVKYTVPVLGNEKPATLPKWW